MTSLIRGALSYITPSSSSTSTPATNDSSPTTPDEDTKKEDVQQGYLKRAVSGLTNGVYSVGSSAVGAGVGGVKWIAGTTYSVGSGVAGAVGTAVGSSAGAVIAKVTPSRSSKEHED